MYIRDANIIIIVYDLTNKASFDHIRQWLKEVNDIKKDKSVIAYIGNKTDLQQKEVKQDEIDLWTNETRCIHLSLSAKTGDGVDYFFEQLFNEISSNFDIKGDKAEDLNITEKFDLSKIKNLTPKKKKCCGGK